MSCLRQHACLDDPIGAGAAGNPIGPIQRRWRQKLAPSFLGPERQGSRPPASSSRRDPRGGPLMRIARCGHPTSSRRGPVGYCDACRPIVDLRMRLRQAGKLARKRGDLPRIVKLLRAIAQDPSTYELDLELKANAARAAREAATRAAATPVEPAARTLPPGASGRPRDPDAVDWATKQW
jgi:hypothetical protein